MGETIFVATSAGADSWPLGICRQQPQYLLHGVSKNASVYQDYLLAHQEWDINKPIESTANYTCMNGIRPFNES